ncbi:hypothetical protein FIA58_012185 [Flavobacterium jejuense]|uniref:Lipoprotein n=1 Tax=Flavobacterium jejuense TaxID=1544455 RepID=A0ABX0IRV6_9FLAO|nr:hypothetical protein [Flavobacterium jejuense]NHN26438.1 hypothetical protein [Flavobacterium jejuense]
MRKHLLIVGITFIYFSCKKENTDAFKITNEIHKHEISTTNNLDNVKTFVVDDFPVSKEVIRKEPTVLENNNLIAFDQVWFKSKNSSQILIYNLYTDFHKINILLFDVGNINDSILSYIHFNRKNGDLAPLEEKKKFLYSFIEKATELDVSFFESNKKVKLGISKEFAQSIYKEPDIQDKKDDFEILKWEYYGDEYLKEYTEEITLNNNKIIAKNSFGHRIEMIFKENKLIAMNLFNDIP